MSGPQELSLTEIRQYMLENNCKVTNHALVKHFKRFLTHHETQNEARKQFKTYVNILATIKTENNQKYLILRKKYINDCPTDEVVQRAVLAAAATAASSGSGSVPSSPGDVSLCSDGSLSSPAPFRQPPPYKPPPEVMKPTTGITVNQEHTLNYRDCVKEFAASVQRIDPGRLARQTSSDDDTRRPEPKQEVPESMKDDVKTLPTTTTAKGENKENLPGGTSKDAPGLVPLVASANDDIDGGSDEIADNPMSVKEATRKFNRMASVEEAKIISPPSKKKPEKNLVEEKVLPDVTLAHPKAKEWIVSMSRASYQELAKLASESPELVKLQDPATGTALHWAAKHGDEDVVKLIAGTYKANVNATSNGGYTPLHLAMQFGRVNIFELLCNVYKADRDVMDCSGKKPLEYRMQRTTVSASTYSKIKAKRKHTEKDLGFLRIGSLNVRVKKTTEAFSNFLGVGNGNGHAHSAVAVTNSLAHPQQRSHRHHHPHHGGTMRTHHHHHHQPPHYHPLTKQPRAVAATMTATLPQGTRASVPISSSKFDKLHKSWGSADNILPDKIAVGQGMMMPPPPKDAVKKRQKSTSSSSKRSSVISNATDSPRDSISSSNSSTTMNSGYSSMPSTPNQLRAPLGGIGAANDIGDSDSDSACGFGSNWSMSGRSSTLSSGNLK